MSYSSLIDYSIKFFTEPSTAPVSELLRVQLLACFPNATA